MLPEEFGGLVKPLRRLFVSLVVLCVDAEEHLRLGGFGYKARLRAHGPAFLVDRTFRAREHHPDQSLAVSRPGHSLGYGMISEARKEFFVESLSLESVATVAPE